MNAQDIRRGIEFMVKVIDHLHRRAGSTPRNVRINVDATGPDYARLKYANAELHVYRGLSQEQLHGTSDRFAQWMLFPYVAEMQDNLSYIFITKAPKKHIFFTEDEIAN